MSENKMGTLNFVRNTATGSEWWHTKEKKVVFENFIFDPDTQDLQELSVIMNADDRGMVDEPEPDHSDEESIFASMTLRELKDYADSKGIDIPAGLKKNEVVEFLEFGDSKETE